MEAYADQRQLVDLHAYANRSTLASTVKRVITKKNKYFLFLLPLEETFRKQTLKS